MPATQWSSSACHNLTAAVADLHIRRDTFPGEVFTQLGADALALAGCDRNHKIDHENLLATHLPEVSFKGRDRKRVHYALLSRFAVHGALEVDLLEEVTYWIEEYWRYESGRLSIVREFADGSEEVPAERAAGEYVGELGPMLGQPGSASTRALEPSTVTSFNLQELRQSRRCTPTSD